MGLKKFYSKTRLAPSRGDLAELHFQHRNLGGFYFYIYQLVPVRHLTMMMIQALRSKQAQTMTPPPPDRPFPLLHRSEPGRRLFRTPFELSGVCLLVEMSAQSSKVVKRSESKEEGAGEHLTFDVCTISHFYS